MDNRETGEMRVDYDNYMAFIHFPKNYTKGLSRFIDDRENYDDDQSMAYVHITKQSKWNRQNVWLKY